MNRNHTAKRVRGAKAPGRSCRSSSCWEKRDTSPIYSFRQGRGAVTREWPVCIVQVAVQTRARSLRQVRQESRVHEGCRIGRGLGGVKRRRWLTAYSSQLAAFSVCGTGQAGVVSWRAGLTRGTRGRHRQRPQAGLSNSAAHGGGAPRLR